MTLQSQMVVSTLIDILYSKRNSYKKNNGFCRHSFPQTPLPPGRQARSGTPPRVQKLCKILNARMLAFNVAMNNERMVQYCYKHTFSTTIFSSFSENYRIQALFVKLYYSVRAEIFGKLHYLYDGGGILRTRKKSFAQIR